MAFQDADVQSATCGLEDQLWASACLGKGVLIGWFEVNKENFPKCDHCNRSHIRHVLRTTYHGKAEMDAWGQFSTMRMLPDTRMACKK
jgi:hypothetical protein